MPVERGNGMSRISGGVAGMNIRTGGAAAIAALTLWAAVPLHAQDNKAPPAAPGANVGSGTAWSTEVAPSNSASISLDPAQLELVKKVSDYFNGINDLKGNFVQTGADRKRMKGKFYVKRPGRFRFDYALPSKQIIISDGNYLAIQDLDLKVEDRVALDQTPFRLLLRKDVDLARDARIVEVQEADDQIILALHDKNPDTPGRIRLVLSTKPSVELKEWTTTDAQGLDTRVEVADLVRTETLDVGMFKIQGVGPNQLQ